LISRRCFISGRVQGVAYRASARAEAAKLGIAGYARNLPDGRVETLLYGPETNVQTMIAWLKIGPPAAHVTRIEVEELELTEPPRGFTTR
jgi:acylphosphatase